MGEIKFPKEYSWVLMGRQRREALKLFPDKPITAEELRKKINEKTPLKLSLREMSRHLTSFVEKGLTKCLNPDAPYNKLYIITDRGKRIQEELMN
ncbi:MAG: hypothetical protein P8X70_00510 [Nanoarchaeota archaeon]